MKHLASRRFWECYRALPAEVRTLADTSCQLLKSKPDHPSLHYKRVGRYRSVRIGLHYRALAIDAGDDAVLWFWIGHHSEYDRLIGSR